MWEYSKCTSSARVTGPRGASFKSPLMRSVREKCGIHSGPRFCFLSQSHTRCAITDFVVKKKWSFLPKHTPEEPHSYVQLCSLKVNSRHEEREYSWHGCKPSLNKYFLHICSAPSTSIWFFHFIFETVVLTGLCASLVVDHLPSICKGLGLVSRVGVERQDFEIQNALLMKWNHREVTWLRASTSHL